MNDDEKFPLLSPSEYEAMLLMKSIGSILTSRIDEKTSEDHVGRLIPGMTIFRKLIKKDLCFITEEEPIEDIDMTPSIELTPFGERMLPVLELYLNKK